MAAVLAGRLCAWHATSSSHQHAGPAAPDAVSSDALSLHVPNSPPAACSHVTDAGVARLALLPRLELLNLGGCARVTGSTLGGFGAHGALTGLSLTSCVALTDAGLAEAARIGSLRHLDVSGCGRVTDEGAAALGALRRLGRLSLRGNPKCTDRCGPGAVGSVSRGACKSLLLTACARSTPTCRKVARCCPVSSQLAGGAPHVIDLHPEPH